MTAIPQLYNLPIGDYLQHTKFIGKNKNPKIRVIAIGCSSWLGKGVSCTKVSYSIWP
ncbi:XRE family transcriptional regulator [Sesbania bispinosa]|nr:XRE family transcriptional regulator [Sesbania bispinosa]